MRKIKFLYIVAGVALLSMLVVSVSFGKEEADITMPGRGSLSKSSDYKPDRYQILNINNLWTWTRSDGISNHSPLGDNGTYFPRRTAWLIYTDGIMWGGRCYTDEALTQPAPFAQEIRVGGTNYVTGCREGHIDGTGAVPVPSSPGDARIYRIRRDYASMSDEDLKADAEESIEFEHDVTDADMQAVYDQYELDWENWPVELGAPYIDRDGDGVYTAPPPFSATFTVDDLIAEGYDEPGIAGADPNSPADQVVWTVFNDLDEAQCKVLQGSEPMGLEVQISVWGYKRTDALGSIYFRRARIINKGGVDTNGDGTADGFFWVDSMYVAQWSDPDLGSAGDDLLGCDTTLSMGYVYNGNANDNEYVKYGLPPPSAGYDFLQGPIVASPGDVAVFDLKYRNDFKNLPMTSFSWFSAGSPISDPPRDYGQGTLRWYKMLRGWVPLDGPLAYYPFPEGVEPHTFPYCGDPVTGTGLLDGQGTTYSFAPGDRRLNCSTGPFTLAPGDTQEVVVAVVCGIGSDRFSSIAVMKFNDRFAQLTYDALFQVSSPPKAPSVTVAEFDGKVILEWGSDMDIVADTETDTIYPGTFVFEGYNVYQFPSSGASITTEGTKRIATYDLPDDPTVILDEQFDVSSGQILMMPVQFGSNSNILRFFEFDRDYVLDIDKIYNGQEYYLAVTAYSRAMEPGFLPAALESPPTVLTVVPKMPFGTEYVDALGNEIYLGDTLAHTHVGASDGAAYPIIIDPTALTGHDYEVTFDTLAPGGEPSWTLKDLTTGETLIPIGINQTGDDDYLFTDGFQLRVVGAPLDFKDFQCVANCNGPIDPPEGAAADFQGFPSLRPTDGQQCGEGHWMFHTGDNGTRGSYAKFKERSCRGDNFDRLVPYDWEMRFTAEGSYSFKGYEANEVVEVPFELWCIGMGTPDDPSDDYRLIPLLLEDIGGVVNNEYDMALWGADLEHSASGGDNDPFTDWVYWEQPVDMSFGEAGYDAYVTALGGAAVAPQAALDLVGAEVLARTVLLNWNGGSAPPFNQDLPEEGTIFRLITTKPNTMTDVFRFTTPAPTTTAALDEFSAKKVGVFPNPYYAFNPAERSKLARFVTFNNLPPKATIRIFNLAGQLVRKIEKDNTSQFQQWNLLNHNSLPVASGMYIAYIEMTLPADGSKATKILKLAIIQEQEVLDVY
ncbi:MAG: T9SS type A sorting domain-containing protein [Bacteroidales bacterium]|nr:T9SS type A sorting domain-containing protein [Bacteroidales bacterium]